MSELKTAVQTILDRAKGYQTAQKYYDGTVDEIFASAKVKRALEKTGNQFRVNYAKTPVDAVGSRLELTGVATLSDQAKQVVDQAWQENNLELELSQIITNTLVYGDSYVFVWPDEQDQTQIYYNSPLTTVVIYDVENPRKPAYAAKMWTIELEDGRQRVRVNLYFAGRICKYISKSESLPMTVQDSDFEPFVDEDTDEQGQLVNEYGQIPIFHLSTGTPEHLSAYGPQNAINKLLISQMSSVEAYGFPTRYVIAGDHTGSPSDFGDDDDSNSLSNEPGELWWLQNVNKVGQFDPAKPETLISPYREYVRAMASVTSTPLSYFENTQTNVSGEALRAAEAPLVKKVRLRQLAIGSALRKMFLFVLKLNQIDEDVQLQWRQIESIDTSETWDIIKKKRDAGLPAEQIWLEHGYDTALIEQWRRAGLLDQPATTNITEKENGDEAA
ncbi:phage portal protein [Rhodococcus sp. JT-3]|uniref:phage portal protein n=1 Tax=Rhodococcus sp. JT-3 TaxID=1973213 RepID=UPI00130377D8|nr:phage portal protein [Rhodococcus sp. JT-3]